MAKDTAVSNEQIIAAIINNGTFEAAAKACGITSRTIRDRMNDPDFRAEYSAAKDELLRQAVINLDNQLSAAVDTIAEIMENPDNNAAVRLQAAQTIINNAAKLAEKLDKDEKTTRRENMTLDQSIGDMFSGALF